MKKKIFHSQQHFAVIYHDVQANPTYQSTGVDIHTVVLELDSAKIQREVSIGLRHCPSTYATEYGVGITLNDVDILKILSYPIYWVQFGKNYGTIIDPIPLTSIAQSIKPGSFSGTHNNTEWKGKEQYNLVTQQTFYYIQIKPPQNNTDCIVIPQNTSGYTYKQLIGTMQVPRLTQAGAEAITRLLTPLLGLPASSRTLLVP